MNENGIEFQNLTKTFGRLEAVKDLSLVIPHGTFVSFIGPSGCGKTTTLRTLAGFEIPTSGRILIDGQDIVRVPPNRRNISMVFQHFALFPHMNVVQNIEYGLRMRGVGKEESEKRVARVLSLLEIEDVRNEPTTKLSGGQQQKVGLARALVTEPKILLLDEPMGSIDEALRVRTQRELRRLFERLRITFIHVTHNQLEAFSMADRIIVMNAGRLVQDDSPENLFRAPETDFVARFVGRNNIFRGVVASSAGRDAVIETPQGVFRLVTDRVIPPKGEWVAFSVRSDLVTVAENGGTQDLNQIEAQVSLLEEIENIRIYHLVSDDGTQLRMERHGMEGGAFLPVGARVRLSWHPHDAVLLKLAG